MHVSRLLPIAVCLALAGCGAKGDSARKVEPPTVRLAAVGTQQFIDRIDAVGTARANEQVTLAAPVTERIVRLNFDDGGFIVRGQVVAVLAQAQQTAQLAEAGARAQEANQQLARVRQLKDRGFATNSAVDTQFALSSQARAQSAQAQASIADRVIRAPFSGWVSLRNISAGAVVQAGTQIAQISDISRIKLDFAVPETLLGHIRVGQPIGAVAAAFPDTPFRGIIASIDPVLNPETRAATVRAIIPNADRRLKPGMLLTVRIEAEARTAPAVPELAVVGEGDESYVFTVVGGKARRTPVRIGQSQNGMVEIVSGLKPGQPVVTEGVVKISDGQAVKIAGAPGAATVPGDGRKGG